MNYKQKALDHVRSVCPELQPPKYLPLPVKYDGMRYHWGKNGEMVADFDEGVTTGDGFRIRGWGRIQNEERQDECTKWIEKAINLGHTPHLEHWLSGIEHLKGDSYQEACRNTLLKVYNLTQDGGNQDESFYKAYCQIVGV